MRRRLLESEQVLLICRQHARVLLWPLVVGVLIFLLTAAGLGRLQVQQYESWAADVPQLRQPAIVLLLSAAILLLIAYPVRATIRWATTRYILTTARIIVRRGNLQRNMSEYHLAKISSMELRQKMAQRINGSGDLVIELSSTVNQVLKEIPYATGFTSEAQLAWQATLHGSSQQAPGLGDYAGVADFVANESLTSAHGKELRQLGRDS